MDMRIALISPFNGDGVNAEILDGSPEYDRAYRSEAGDKDVLGVV